MTIAGNQGQNVYPFPDNYPESSFPQPIPAPDVDPDAGFFITVRYGWQWQQVLLAAIDQLRNPATWEGDHDTVIAALNRATNLKAMLQVDLGNKAPTPYWDEDTEVDDEMPDDVQPWYGTVSNPEAPPDELDFVENAAIFAFTGFLALATWEIGAAPAILFHTIAPKFVLAMRRGDAGEIIRILVDGEEAARVDTSGVSVGDVVRVPIIADPAITTGHDIAVIQVS